MQLRDFNLPQREDSMTEQTLPLTDLLTKAGDPDFLRSAAEAVVQMLMEADVEGLIGAARHEWTGERVTYRNGCRDRSLDTRLGALQLRIRKLRQGSFHYVDGFYPLPANRGFRCYSGPDGYAQTGVRWNIRHPA